MLKYLNIKLRNYLLVLLITHTWSARCQINWQPVGQGLSNMTFALYNDTATNSLIVGGADFPEFNSNIVRYNGSEFAPMDIGILEKTTGAPSIMGFIRFQDTLFAIALTIGIGMNDSVFGMAYWKNDHWSPFNPDGLFNKPSDLAEVLEYDSKMFVVGRFTRSPKGIRRIAYYKEGHWNGIGMSTGWFSWANTMTIYRGELYIGGYMDSLGNDTANHLIKYDGNVWSAVASNDIGEILKLGVYGDTLFASDNYGRVYRLDSTTWELFCTADNRILSFKETPAGLLVGGYFTNIDGQPLNSIALWNGSGWESLGDGFPGGQINDIELFESDIFVSGVFTDSPNSGISNIARWGLPNSIDDHGKINIDILLKPNPNNGSFTVLQENIIFKAIEIFDLTGRLIFSDRMSATLSNHFNIELSPGLYVVKFIGLDSTYSTKMKVN